MITGLTYLSIGFILIIYFALWFFILAPLLKKTRPDGHKTTILPPVSVIICARNAAHHLQQNLAAILEQEYPDFEVIVVNDVSEDTTGTVLAQFQATSPLLRIITVDHKKSPGKKEALATGIAHAAHEWLLMTDSDCRPSGKHWIRSMMLQTGENKKLVLGYGPYSKKNGLLNMLVRFDTARIALQYMGMAMNGNAYMGVGRNMAYTRSLYTSAGGFQRHLHIASGDDDLFVQEASTAENTQIVLSSESYMYSVAPASFRQWFWQKKRHVSAFSHYRPGFKFLLTVLPAFSAFMYMLCLVLFFTGNPLAACLLLGGKGLISYLLFSPWLLKTGEKDLILFIPLLDLIYIFVLFIFSLLNIFSAKRAWS